ncbi:4-(cytidine 5'-diphospho)-2-C-methyl-D-erythritol kinase [soil metagenome]
MSLRTRAPAKLNLTLAVGPRAEDGFHPLRSVFARLALADELAVDPAPAAGADVLTVGGDYECPVEGNLVLRAFSLLREAAGLPLPPLSAQLVKRIPVGGGLAGGSSDGAAALELAARAWGIGLSPEWAAELESRLGSDVPFFARGGEVALVESRGEVVRPLPGIVGGAGILLCTSKAGLSTAAVYGRFDQLGGSVTRARPVTDELLEALAHGIDGAGLAELGPLLRAANDLWPAAVQLAPEIVGRRDVLERLTGRPWLLTGSGPTLFAIYPSVEQARAAAASWAAPSGTTLVPTALGSQADEGRAR